MSPIPKPPKALNPVQKAIAALIDETQRKGSAVIDGVIVHPSDLSSLRELLADEDATRSAVRSTLFEEMKKNQANIPVFLGRPPAVSYQGQRLNAVVYDEAGDTLLQELQDSLWAMATMHTPVFTREDLYQHVGPGHMEDDWYVKRMNDMEVLLLCKCRMILVLSRCMYGYDKPVELGEWCEEPAFPAEATARKDARCTQHMGTQKGKA